MHEYPLQQLLADIEQSASPAEFDAVARRALEAFDVLNDRIIAERQVKLACGDGCSTCCTLRVDVFAHEVFPIARYIREHFSPGKLEALMERLMVHAEAVLAMTPFEHATTNLQCPLLEDRRCSIYEVRAHSCRRHHSQDFSACQYTFDHPTDLDTPAAHDRELFKALTVAMHEDIDAYAELGYDYHIYELGTALLEALIDPASWDSWANREQAFLQASITPAE
jgi:Fe-S-cluster containining protein